MHLDTVMEPQTQSNGWPNNCKVRLTPSLRLCRQIKIQFQQIDKAVKSFANEVEIKGDKIGFVNQTLESIASSTFLRKEGSGNDFWTLEDEDGLKGYVLAGLSKDVDNQLCYWVSQAWLHPQYRGTGNVKEYWQTLKDYAKQNFCKHILIISGRGNRAYQRLLGRSLSEYATILKEDI